jgi:hypothetical protein
MSFVSPILNNKVYHIPGGDGNLGKGLTKVIIAKARR